MQNMKTLLVAITVLFFSNAVFAAPGDTTVVQISDTNLSTLYYHQTNFATPTKLVFTNLTSVNGPVYFHQDVNLVEVDFPVLQTVNGYFYFYQNVSLQKIIAPNLTTVGDYLYVEGNTALTQLDICNLKQIIPVQAGASNIYYYVVDNTAGVDATPLCFSAGAPANLSISQDSVLENQPAYTFIGKLSATKGSTDKLYWFLANDFASDNYQFIIRNDSLFTASTFDYDAKNSYNITVDVINQIGEKAEKSFSIFIKKQTNEDTAVVEIDDTVLSSVYYQTSFLTPTKLVFKNLTTVNGYVYFHQNVNLVSVDFPLLQTTAGYFYVNGNTALQKISAPNLTSITEYLYINGNTTLNELDICNLKQILSAKDSSSGGTYYYVANNTPAIDSGTLCFSKGAPTNIIVSQDSVRENLPAYTMVGKLSATARPTDVLTWYLPALVEDNAKFFIRNDTLYTATAFDYETQNKYTIQVGVTNQIGEKTVKDFSIFIKDQVIEDTVVIEIDDTTLSSVYYHQISFTTPTKLVFKNLVSVNGYVYFHQNINLVAVDFPALQSTNDYFYFYDNTSLLTINAPNLTTIKNYLYVDGNTSLSQLNACGLRQILPGDSTNIPYYYIHNNGNNDYTAGCFGNTHVIFVPASIIIPAANTYIGYLMSDADTTVNSIRYYFVDGSGKEITSSDFIIRDDSVFLANAYSSYTDSSFTFDVGGIRYSKILSRPAGGATVPLNEKITLNIKVGIGNTLRYSNTWIGACKTLATSAWENPANWSFNVLPDANTDVIINNGNINVGTNAICRSLTIQAGAHINVVAGVTFKILK